MEFSSQSWLRFSLNLPEPDQNGDLQKIWFSEYFPLSFDIISRLKLCALV